MYAILRNKLRNRKNLTSTLSSDAKNASLVKTCYWFNAKNMNIRVQCKLGNILMSNFDLHQQRPVRSPDRQWTTAFL